MIRFVFLIALFVVPVSAWAEEAAKHNSGRSGIGLSGGNNNQNNDPTRNVLDLVEAAIKRQDDLRGALRELTDAKVAALNELNMLRSRYDKEILKAATDRLDSEAKLRAEYAERLVIAEAGRINSIRAVDVGAAAIDRERAAAQAAALAREVTQTAEVLRNQQTRLAEDLRVQIQTTAATALQSQQQQFTGITTSITALSNRITTLEQSGAEGKGSARFQDPAIAALTAQVNSLVQSRSSVAGVGEGRGDVIAWILAGLGLLFGAVTAVIAFNRRKPA